MATTARQAILYLVKQRGVTQVDGGGWRVRKMVRGTRHDVTVVGDIEAYDYHQAMTVAAKTEAGWFDFLEDGRATDERTFDEVAELAIDAKCAAKKRAVTKKVRNLPADRADAEVVRVVSSYRRENLSGLKRFSAAFGSRPISSLSPRAVGTFFNELEGELSGSRLNTMRAKVRLVFTYAIRKLYVDFPAGNPSDSIARFEVDSDGIGQPLTREQVELLYEAADGVTSPGYLRVLAATAYETGHRMGVICSLRWDAIDFEGRCIHTTRLTKRGDLETLAMTDELAEILTAHRREYGLRSQLVFPGWDRRTQTYSHPTKSIATRYTRAWREAVEAARLVDPTISATVRMHDLRHSRGTQLIEDGATEREGMEYLGHSTAEMFRRYSKHAARPKAAALAKTNAAAAAR